MARRLRDAGGQEAPPAARYHSNRSPRLRRDGGVLASFRRAGAVGAGRAGRRRRFEGSGGLCLVEVVSTGCGFFGRLGAACPLSCRAALPRALLGARILRAGPGARDNGRRRAVGWRLPRVPPVPGHAGRMGTAGPAAGWCGRGGGLGSLVGLFVE